MLRAPRTEFSVCPEKKDAGDLPRASGPLRSLTSHSKRIRQDLPSGRTGIA